MLSLVQWSSVAGFLFVLYRAVTLVNYPLLETDPKPRESHKWRLITAAFYVPFVPATAIFFPLLFKLFLSLMIYLAVQEYLQVLFQLRYRLTPEQKADKKEDDTDITTPKKGRRRLSSASKKEEPVMGGESGEMTKFLNFARKIQVAGLLVSMSAYPGDHRLFAFVVYFAFILLVGLFMWNFQRKNYLLNDPEHAFYNALATLCIYLLCLIWVFMPLSYGILMADYEDGGAYLTMVLCISWIGDASAYYVGSRFGYHKNITEISPNKTWEGVVSEVIFAVGLAYLFKRVQMAAIVPWMNLPDVSVYHYLFIGLLIGVLGVIGDLFESLVKRAGFAKDSGIFFPGHGGVLDRFDSFLFATPAVYYYILFVIKGQIFATTIDWAELFTIRNVGSLF